MPTAIRTKTIDHIARVISWVERGISIYDTEQQEFKIQARRQVQDAVQQFTATALGMSSPPTVARLTTKPQSTFHAYFDAAFAFVWQNMLLALDRVEFLRF